MIIRNYSDKMRIVVTTQPSTISFDNRIDNKLWILEIARARNFFSVIFPASHGNIWSQARNTETNIKTWHREQNLPVVVLRKANLFKRVVSAL